MSLPVCRRIAAHAAADPERPAVIDAGTRLTYGALEHRALRLADRLRAEGVGPERCVGLWFERSTDFVIAMLAVAKADGAYVPLDASLPPARTAELLARADATMLLTHRGLSRALDGLTNLPPVVDLDESLAVTASDGANEARMHPDPDPCSLAYVIYTSGSTGAPHGVEISHGNLINLIDWHVSAFRISPADHAGHVAGLGFDAAAWEIWPHLVAGATLHVADEATRQSADALRDWLVAEGITIAFVPTVLAEALFDADWPPHTALRTMLTGGDVLHRRPPAGLPFHVVNNYGPTECTVVATSGVVEPRRDDDVEDDVLRPSIGRPVHNAKAVVVDDRLRPVPAGQPGELCLAGAIVGRGYRNDRALTSRRFVAIAANGGPPVRSYRTGDRVRQLPDGNLEFLGRLDDQVKIRGYRIEPAEIAAVLDQCPGVISSVVIGVGEGPETRLVAYVVPGAGARPTVWHLSEFLGARLPPYMVPSQFVGLPSLPMTANGKLDRAALPAPTPENVLPDRSPAEHLPARDPLSREIGELVATLLDHQTVPADQNFFLIGGHSLLGAQLVARIRDRYGVPLTLRQLFEGPTIEALTATVARLATSAHDDDCRIEK